MAVSNSAKRKLGFLSLIVLAIVAGLSWWTIIEEGPSNARLIAAVASSVAALVQLVLVWKQRSAASPESA